MKRVVCFGPGPIFKGGIQNYNSSLAKALAYMPEVDVIIVSWTQMYPAILPRDLVDRSSKSQVLEGSSIQVHYITDYNNPFTWSKTVNYIFSLNPDMVIFQWSISIQGLPIGWIAKKLKRKTHAEIIFDCHFVIQKERSVIDGFLTKYALKGANTFITHASQTTQELKQLFPQKEYRITKDGQRKKVNNSTTIIELFHPVYNLFEPDEKFDVEAFKKENDLKKNVFLFFGFIRKYKGLHNVIRAFKLLSERRNDISLIICGESFWETLDKNKISTKLKKFIFSIIQKVLVSKKDKESDYRPLSLIDELGISELVMLKNEFIPNEDVHKYFQASDSVLLFYEYATPSGIESISYNFKKPLLATSVGHFPETVDDEINGFLAKPNDIVDMANVMEKSINSPIDPSRIEAKVKDMSWENYAQAICGKKD